MNVLHTTRLRLEALCAANLPLLYHGVLKLWGRSNGMKVLQVALVRSGDVVLDVGANRGIFTALLSNLVGANGRVHAFEPSPTTCQLLHQSLAERARLPGNVVINQSAVGDEDGVTTLYTPHEDHGQASLRTHDAGSWSADVAVGALQCPITKLDSYVDSQRLTRVDIVKMDVEGAELLALRGFAAGLRRFHPVVICELCGAWTHAFDYAPTAVIALLREAGYDTFYVVTDGGDLRHLTDPVELNDGASHDIVAAVNAAHSDRLRRALSASERS